MKLFVNAAIAISLFAPAAYAGNAGALASLLAQAGPAAVSVAVPEAHEALTAPLTSGLSDLDPAQANAVVLRFRV